MLSLNCPLLDGYHEQSETLLSSFDFAHFEASFLHLIDYTKEHFAHEESLMQAHNFYGYREHCDEHHTILAEMQRFYDMALLGNTLFAKNYIKSGIAERFDVHIRTIDSQLAMFLKRQDL